MERLLCCFVFRFNIFVVWWKSKIFLNTANIKDILQEDIKPIGSILLKDVLPYMCVGLMTDRMPIRRPNLPANCSVHHLIGIGMDPRAEKVYWFLFDSDSDLEAWFNEIMKTLPMPANVENSQKISGGDATNRKHCKAII